MGTCEWCGAEFSRAVRNGDKKRFCRATCRVRFNESVRKLLLGVESLYAPRSAVYYNKCQYCTSLYVARGPRSAACSSEDCQKQHRNARQKRYFQEYFDEHNTYPAEAARKRAGDARRARKRGVVREKFDKAAVFERDNWMCRLCGKPVDRDLRFPDPSSPSLDHIIPLSFGGPHTAANVQLAHFGCNSRRQNRPIREEV